MHDPGSFDGQQVNMTHYYTELRKYCTSNSGGKWNNFKNRVDSLNAIKQLIIFKWE